MKKVIFSRTGQKDGMIDFYVECGSENYYIFSRKFRTTLFNFFKNGVYVHNLFDFGRTHGNEVIINTMIQLKGMLRYIEKENGLKILNSKNVKRPFNRREKLYESDLAA